MFDVAIAFDRNLLHVAHVVVRSAVANASAPLRVHALTRGITREEFAGFVWRSRWGSRCAEIHQIEMDHHDWGDVKIGTWLSISTMDRIHLPGLLQDVERCLYVDIDCVTLGDVNDLLDIDHGECGITAKASTRPTFRTMRHFAKRAKIDHGKLVEMVGNNPLNFNAGVLWMNLETLRKQRMAERASELVAATRCNDQLALVGYSNGRFGTLPARWNAWAPIDAGKPQTKPLGVLHYLGNRKPWDGEKLLREHWDRYA